MYLNIKVLPEYQQKSGQMVPAKNYKDSGGGGGIMLYGENDKNNNFPVRREIK